MALNREEVFYASQVMIGGLFAWLVFRSVIKQQSQSNFRVREADLRKNSPRTNDQSLAQARLKRQTPLQLSGIRLDAEPHEILGVQKSATASEIQKAYRNLMKIYHPDKIGAPGSREWQDAQKIAEAINHAKDSLLKSAK